MKELDLYKVFVGERKRLDCIIAAEDTESILEEYEFQDQEVEFKIVPEWEMKQTYILPPTDYDVASNVNFSNFLCSRSGDSEMLPPNLF